MSRLKPLLFVLVLAAQAPLASATVTYVVGTCKPTFPLSSIFMHIQNALDATPAPNVVEVCPGTYPEQVVISRPVTIEGISDGTSTGATITVPPGGLAINTGDDFGDFIAAQVWVDNVAGEVNLANITVEGLGSNVGIGSYIVGVFYQNSPGTVNHVMIQDQVGSDPSVSLQGVGVWLEGGSNKPSVTVENSAFVEFDNTGIRAETNSSASELTATISKNTANGTPTNAAAGIASVEGVTASISGNFVTGSSIGIYADSEGSISKNTIVGIAPAGGTGIYIPSGGVTVTSNSILTETTGIDIEADGVTVTSNSIYGGDVENTIGIRVHSSVAPVTDNIIVQTVFGLDFACTALKNVHSNTLEGAGVIRVPSGAVVTANTYYDVDPIISLSNTCQ